MNILLIEPFFTGSHAQWAKDYKKYSSHHVEILSLPGKHWKWRMEGGAIPLAKQFLATDYQPDLILVTDMLNLSTFLSLIRPEGADIPTALYFHENQLAYPWSSQDRAVRKNLDHHYKFINYTSALAADHILFNSAYNLKSFLERLPKFLAQFPDQVDQSTIQVIEQKSTLLPLGIDLHALDKHRPNIQKKNQSPLILWNHRWAYDKDPDTFFESLDTIGQKGIDYRLAVLGNGLDHVPRPFRQFKKKWENKIVQFGHVRSFNTYAQWLWKADILLVTAQQEFFGTSVMEALYCRTFPLLPNRLSYPTLLSPANYPECFYNDQKELMNRLEKLLRNGHAEKTTDQLRSISAQYDWSKMAPEYDQTFERII